MPVFANLHDRLAQNIADGNVTTFVDIWLSVKVGYNKQDSTKDC